MSDSMPTTFTPAPPSSVEDRYPGSYPNQYQPEPKYNLFSLISFISAFFLSVPAVVMGHMALSEIKKTGERGRGLALAGLILGYLGTLAGLALTVLLIVVALASPTSSEFGVLNSKAPSGTPQTAPAPTEAKDLPSPTAEGTVSAHFCDVMAGMNASEQAPEDMLNSYKRLGEVDSPNQQVYAEFYTFVANSQDATPDPAELQTILDKVQVASVSDSHACAALNGK
ncbi:MAG: DUF4190 domain-containing protein [Actinomycetota bacterium]